MRVGVLGLGYVGSVTAACLAREGHRVCGVDLDPAKVAAVRSGRAPITEPGLHPLMAEVRSAGTLDATDDVEAAVRASDIVLVCVGTPSLRGNGALDLGQVERVSEQIGAALRDRTDRPVVVYRSSMVPGTVEERLVPVLERASGRVAGVDFGVAMCPEFLREAVGVADFYDPPFTVVGAADDWAAAAVEQCFAFLRAPVHRVDLRSAEALKYSCNAYHALKVAFANEVGRLCRASGADARRVMDIFCRDDRLNISSAYLRPGFAFGGSCLPKDLRALLHRGQTLDVDLPLLGAVLTSNAQHLRSAIDWVLGTEVRSVALLGLSFKDGTDDLRESPFVELAETLIGKGVDVRIFDPIVHPERLRGSNRTFVEQRLPHLGRLLHTTAASAIAGAECVVIGSADEESRSALAGSPPPRLLDLSGGIGAPFEELPGYAGVAW